MELFKTILLFVGMMLAGIVGIGLLCLAIASPVILIVWLLLNHLPV